MNNLNVVFLSDWLGNPYKRLLAKHLAPLGVHVEEYSWTVFFLPKVLSITGIFKPGILHLHTLHPFLLGRYPLSRAIKLLIFVTQILLLRVSGTKTVWTVHEWTDKIYNGKNSIPPISARILGTLLAFISHCKSTGSEVAEAFDVVGKNRDFVIPHANYIGCYANTLSQAEARKALDIPDENLVFLLFGSIYRYKGVLELIDAFKRLQQNNVTLLIAGNLAEQSLKDLVPEQVEADKNILLFAKRIPDEDVQLYMNACDCVVTPYQTFTTSGVSLLAMSFAKACIAPRAGFFVDVLDEAGSIFYDPTDENGLLHTMKTTIENKAHLSTMGEHNLQLAKQWSWDYVAHETLEVYQKCLAS